MKHEGRDVTIVTLSLMVHRALDAADDLAAAVFLEAIVRRLEEPEQLEA